MGVKASLGLGEGRVRLQIKKMTAQASPPGRSMPHPHQALQEA